MNEKKISGWNAPVKATSLSSAKELHEKAERPIEEPKKPAKAKAKSVKGKTAKAKKPAAKKPAAKKAQAKKPAAKKKAK